MSQLTETQKINWQKLIAPYTHPDLRRSLWQVANTLIPYILLWPVMLWSLDISYWLTLLLAIPAAGFLVRAFIIFHDCCHGSFFASRRANETLGSILGVLTFTSFHSWKHGHAIHHATSGNLDRRGQGDIPTMTVQEYLAAPWHLRFGYRLLRSPLFLFPIGAPLLFLVLQRIWTPGQGKRERNGIIYTDLALLALFGGLGLLVGFKEMFLVLLPIAILSSSAGVWLFYVQHQFEGAYWERKDQWDFLHAGLQGSSFYRLPAVLQWFTGNIGFHHIHHLSPKIPNYLLPKCHANNPSLQVAPLSLRASLKSVRLHLWDEQKKQLVGFEALKQYTQPAAG